MNRVVKLRRYTQQDANQRIGNAKRKKNYICYENRINHIFVTLPLRWRRQNAKDVRIKSDFKRFKRLFVSLKMVSWVLAIFERGFHWAARIHFEIAKLQANMGTQRDGESGPRYKSRGVMIMKTVSILLVNSRRVSNQRREKSAAAAATGKKRKIKMDESAGKVTPKLLESLKKRTHFSKYLNGHRQHLRPPSSYRVHLPFQKRIDCSVQDIP